MGDVSAETLRSAAVEEHGGLEWTCPDERSESAQSNII